MENLNEEVSRIKSMMKMVNEGEYTNENLGMLARIAAPMAASYIGSKMADANEGDLNELGGYIGDAPEKIDGPFLKEIDPSVYEGVSYVEALYTDILLMRLYRNNLISKDSFNEVRKPIVKIIDILRGEQEDKQKDLPF